MEQNSSISNSKHADVPATNAPQHSESTAAVGVVDTSGDHQSDIRFAVIRLCGFLALVAILIVSLDSTITAGLRRMTTSIYGVNNRIMRGEINADIVITGSSRAASHYDPRVIERVTGRRTFNLGRNGSQTDMQIAVFNSYLKHNRRPGVVLHNLDAFTFQTTPEVYNPAQYVPYLAEEDLYGPLRRINPHIWKSRYLPLYGYVAEDMSFSWLLGLKAFVPLLQKDHLIDGFDPRDTKWTNEFDQFKDKAKEPVRWEIQPEGVRLMEGLLERCRRTGIHLILVYSPEYSEMQKLTGNRDEIFSLFKQMASRYRTPLLDYSNWRHAADTRYFTNSQHLNLDGAEEFSNDLAQDLKTYIETESAAVRPGGITTAGHPTTGAVRRF